MSLSCLLARVALLPSPSLRDVPETRGSLGYQRNTGREISSAVAPSYLLQPELQFLRSLFSRALILGIMLAAVTAQSPQSSAASPDSRLLSLFMQQEVRSKSFAQCHGGVLFAKSFYHQKTLMRSKTVAGCYVNGRVCVFMLCKKPYAAL